MNTFGLVLIMVGGLLVWAGLTDNSIVELMKGIVGKGSTAPKDSNSGGAAGAGAGGGGGGGKKH